MAVYFAPAGHGSRSASLGASLGQGLGQTLQMLAQNKMLAKQQEIQQQMAQDAKRQKAFDIGEGLAALGVPAEVGQKIGLLPEKQQEMFLQQFFGSQASMPQAQQGLVEMLGASPEGLGEQPGAGQMLEGLAPEAMQPEGVPQEGAPGPQMQPESDQIRQQVQDQVNKLSPADKSILKREIERLRSGVPIGASKEAEPGYRLQTKPTRQKTFQELLATPRPSKEDKAKARKMAMEEEKLSLAKQKEINQDTRKYFEETMKAGKASRENEMRLNRMKTLLKKGNLTNPAFYNILNTIDKGIFGFGINLKFLMNPDSQEFEKLSTDFTKNAKDIFGSRVTQSEIQLFLKTIPTLAQTDEGKRRVLRNWDRLNKAGKLKKKAMLDIIEMNGGRRPAGLEALVEKKVGPQLDKLAEDFAVGKKKKKKAPSGILGRIFSGIGAAKDWMES